MLNETLDVQAEVENVQRKNYKDRRDLRFFCEKDVSHFARHLSTWHSAEIEVTRILSYKTRSKERRIAISNLKKRGNFIRNRITDNLRPVRRLKEKNSL